VYWYEHIFVLGFVWAFGMFEFRTLLEASVRLSSIQSSDFLNSSVHFSIRLYRINDCCRSRPCLLFISVYELPPGLIV